MAYSTIFYDVKCFILLFHAMHRSFCIKTAQLFLKGTVFL